MAGEPTGRIFEEITSSGEGSGIEREIPAASGAPAALDAEKVDLHTRTMTIDQLLPRVRDNAVQLVPDLQRRVGVWDGVRQSRLIESLLLKIPIPALYAAEDARENWTIVDGVHRLAAILRFVDARIVGETPLVLEGLEYLDKDFGGKAFAALSPRLQRRLKETELVIHVVRHGTPDREKFNIFSRIGTAAAPLSAQEIRHALNAGPARGVLMDWAHCKEFRRATGDAIRDERMAACELVLRFIAFRLWPPAGYEEEDFNLFLGRAMVELNRLALEAEAAPEGEDVADESEPETAPAPIMQPAPEPDEGDFDDAEIPDVAAGPEETGEPREAEKPEEPAESASGVLSRLETEFREAMEMAFSIFAEDAFRKPSGDGGPRHPVNRALFETVSVGIAALGDDERKQLAIQKDALRKYFTELLQNRTFDAAISREAGDAAMVRKRFAETAKVFKKVL